MSPRFSASAPVRKEVRSLGVCAAAHIVDGVDGNTEVSKLQSKQRREVAMRLGGVAPNHPATARSSLHLQGHFCSDFECFDPDVRPDRDDQLRWVVGQRFDRARNNSCDRPTPTGVHRANVPAPWMRDEHRHAIGGPSSDRETLDARDEPVSLEIRSGLGDI